MGLETNIHVLYITTLDLSKGQLHKVIEASTFLQICESQDGKSDQLKIFVSQTFQWVDSINGPYSYSLMAKEPLKLDLDS